MPATRECPTCHEVVPAVVFCGACGAAFDFPASRWQGLLRPNAYAAAAHEAVFVPWLTSTLCPRLPSCAARPYRVAFVALVLFMAVMSALQWNAPAATFSVLVVPLLFVLYAWQSDAFRDDRRRMLVGLALGAIIGAAWWWVSGVFISNRYGVTNAVAEALQNSLTAQRWLVPLIGVAFQVLPVLLIRLIPGSGFEALDGFVVGAASVLAYKVASYIVWWGPQIVAGLINEQTTTGTRMLVDAITYGVIDPLTGIALGGMVGIGLWFRPDPAGPQPGRARAAVILCAVVAVVLTLPLLRWLAAAFPNARWDNRDWPWGLRLAVDLLWTALSLVTLRIGLQIALLTEKRDAATGAPILCVYCEKVVPDMAFCPACGVSARACSPSSRRLRRENPPMPVAVTDYR